MSMQKKDDRELGFGNRLYRSGVRLINADGTFNVHKSGRGWFRPYDSFTRLLEMSWTKFGCLVLLYYFSINLLFSLIYLSIGVEYLEGTVGETMFEHWLDSFFFSAQTITTLGYGRISPIGTGANVVAAIESLIGLLGFALVTGILYGRFSRPNARILFSKNALLAPYQDHSALMFRIANERSSELIELEVQFIISFVDKKEERRKFQPLELELDRINFLSLTWTIVHPITETSPLYGLDEAGMAAIDAEFMILVKGFDDTFSQTVYKRYSYRYEEVVWGAKFKSVIMPPEKGGKNLILELNRIDEYYAAELPA